MLPTVRKESGERRKFLFSARSRQKVEPPRDCLSSRSAAEWGKSPTYCFDHFKFFLLEFFSLSLSSHPAFGWHTVNSSFEDTIAIFLLACGIHKVAARSHCLRLIARLSRAVRLPRKPKRKKSSPFSFHSSRRVFSNFHPAGHFEFQVGHHLKSLSPVWCIGSCGVESKTMTASKVCQSPTRYKLLCLQQARIFMTLVLIPSMASRPGLMLTLSPWAHPIESTAERARFPRPG